MTQQPVAIDNTTAYILHLADSALILGHRNSEWCGHGPVLEQDIAITNISLDLIGQARNFYQYAAALLGNGATEDTLAYRRDAHEFLNLFITELPKGDWAHTILRQFLFSSYQQLLFTRLSTSADEQLAAITTKALKEISYHVRWSAEWVIRLGDGTEISRQKMETALEQLWPSTGELFTRASFEENVISDSDILQMQEEWRSKVNNIFQEATLVMPPDARRFSGGKSGNHEHLEELLSEMQYLQRTYPDAQW